jgi:hypothetical protein
MRIPNAKDLSQESPKSVTKREAKHHLQEAWLRRLALQF